MLSNYEKCPNHSSYGLEYYTLLYRHGGIYYYNIFNNGNVDREIKKIAEDHPVHSELVQRLASIFMYSFWSKSEYEMIVTPWMEHGGDEEKVDVWDQIYPNLETIAAMVEQKLGI